jgi:hypothetical protein
MSEMPSQNSLGFSIYTLRTEGQEVNRFFPRVGTSGRREGIRKE